MKLLPLPLRVAAGLAVTAGERVRELPKDLVGLPVTVISHVLQLCMRLQQQVTELAIKGDDVLSSLRPVEETPDWATFDEDLPAETPKANNGHRPAAFDRDPWEQEERALAEDHTEGEFDTVRNVVNGTVDHAHPISTPEDTGTAGIANYDELSLPQLRARLRRFSLEQLETLLAYERAHENRPSFVGMLARRIGNVQRLSGTDTPGDDE